MRARAPSSATPPLVPSAAVTSSSGRARHAGHSPNEPPRGSRVGHRGQRGGRRFTTPGQRSSHAKRRCGGARSTGDEPPPGIGPPHDGIFADRASSATPSPADEQLSKRSLSVSRTRSAIIEVAGGREAVWEQLSDLAKIVAWYDDWDRCEPEAGQAGLAVLNVGSRFRLIADRRVGTRMADCIVVAVEKPTLVRWIEQRRGHPPVLVELTLDAVAPERTTIRLTKTSGRVRRRSPPSAVADQPPESLLPRASPA